MALTLYDLVKIWFRDKSYLHTWNDNKKLITINPGKKNQKVLEIDIDRIVLERRPAQTAQEAWSVSLFGDAYPTLSSYPNKFIVDGFLKCWQSEHYQIATYIIHASDPGFFQKIEEWLENGPK